MSTAKLHETLQSLQQQQCALEQEWQGLPDAEHRAKLRGDKDAVVELMIRRHQIPWEYVDTLQKRAEVVQAFLEQEDAALEKRAAQLRSKLTQAVAALEAAYRELEPLQQEYGLIQAHVERELQFYELQRSPYGMRFLHSSVKRRDKREDLQKVAEFIGFCAELKEQIEQHQQMERAIELVEGRPSDNTRARLSSYLSIERRVQQVLESF